MLLKNRINSRQRRHNHLVVITLRLQAITVFLGFVTISSAFGQMGYSTTYSDIWVDTSGVDQNRAYNEGETVPGAYVVGCGLTQDSYNTFGHRYWVTTTLTGQPNGRTASGTSPETPSYSRVEVQLPWTFNEAESGDYSVNSTHYLYCPYIYGTVSSTTFDLVQVGLSVACYYKEFTAYYVDHFRIFDSCSPQTTCPGPGSYTLPALLNTRTQLYLSTWVSGGVNQPRHCTGVGAPFNNNFKDCDASACRDIPR